MRVHSGTAWGLDSREEWSGDWTKRAACRNGDPEAMFVDGADQHLAKRLCKRCPVALDCLVEALNNRVQHGVWGGVTDRQRRLMLKARPEVTDWRPLLEEYAAGRVAVVERGADGRKKRRGPPTPEGEHGTDNAYARHYRNGEEPCWPCRLAHRQAMQDYYAERRAKR